METNKILLTGVTYMSDQSCIFWFSGTGNSLHAAKLLSAELGNLPLIQITDASPTGAVGGKAVKVGFVFPSYYGNLPRAVRTFIEKLEIAPDTYIFAVVTMGAVGQGSVAAIDKALKEKSLRLNYGRGVRMPANYVISYNPADPAKSTKTLHKADARLHAIAAEIAAGEQTVKTFPFTAKNLYKDVAALDAAFAVSDRCTGCGLCERICPVGNITMTGGKPSWQHHCEHCVACISWCPAKAIEYGEKTVSRRRYRNPDINANELTRQSP
jgi:ferredoxin